MEFSNLNEREIPANTVLAFEYALWLTCGGMDVSEKKAELEEKIRITKRRLSKTIDREWKSSRNLKNRQAASSTTYNMTEKNHQKRRALKTQLEALKREYGAILAVELGVPLNYVLTSRVYRNNGEVHFLLGEYDPEIGKNHHGHLVFDGNGKCRYLRLPYERHGANNAFKRPLSIIQVMAQKCGGEA